MKRVASLYLPDWPIERIVQAQRAGRTTAPPDATDPQARDEVGAGHDMVSRTARRVSGWRPGARWARTEQDYPHDRRAGCTSEAADHPFKAMPPDEGGAPVRDLRASRSRHLGIVGDMSPPAGEQPLLERQNHRLVPGAGVRQKPSSGPSNISAMAVKPSAKEATAPLVTSMQQGNKLLIAAASPAARALGIVPGMAVTQARAQQPGLDIRPADPEGDHAALRRLAMLLARRWCPVVMLSGADGLLLDITGTAHLYGGEARMARRVVRLLARAGFTARVAVADTPGAAWALARYSTFQSVSCRHPRLCGNDAAMDRVLIIPTGDHTDAIAPLPIAALRLESRAIELLKRLGVDSVGQLAALPRAPLARRFGGSLVARLDQATGHLPEPLAPVVPPDHIAVVQRFAEPIATAEAIAHWLDRLVAELTASLRTGGRGARVIDLIADHIDGQPQMLRIGVARASRDPAHLARLLLRRIETIDPGFGIDALALHVRRSESLGPQPFGGRLDEDAVPDLAPLVDTLAIRIGPDRVWRMRPVESDVPERSIAATAVLDPPERHTQRLKPGDVRQLDRTLDLHPWHHRWPRPVRMLHRPELLDHVIAELPDQPPRRFTWRGHTHRVVRADGPERILGEWWKRTAERDSVRDYFRVEDEVGQRFWLFRRGDGERGVTGDLAWFMHGAFG